MRPRVAAERRDEDGAVAVEFALVFPLLVFLMVSLVILASLMLRYTQLVAGAREGARFASLTQSATPEIDAVVRSGIAADGFTSLTIAYEARNWSAPSGTTAASPGAFAPLASAQPCNELDQGAYGRDVKVVVTGLVPVRAPIVGSTVGSITMRAAGVFRCE